MHNKRARSFYRSIHWGLNPEELLELDGYPHLPQWTAALGRPVRLKTSHANFGAGVLKGAHLLVDPKRKDLFVVGVEPNPRALAAFPEATLPEIARAAGGKRARLRYPNLPAIDLGPLRHIDYRADKAKRGENITYLHEVLDCGEGRPRARHRCRLAWDGTMLWIIGGDYTVTAHGIVG